MKTTALSFGFFLFTGLAQANLDCLDHGEKLSMNEDQVLEWKREGKNQFRGRAHVEGVVVQDYGLQGDHVHFGVMILTSTKDQGTVEVIFNTDFGVLPPIVPGRVVEVCGDYITSNAPARGYPASPDKAIIHWVHFSKRPVKHDSGYLVLDGQLYGDRIEKEF